MDFKIINQVSSRWRDGRTFSAMPGRTVTVDETDLDAVAHMRHLVAVGDAEEITPAVVEEPTKAELVEELREQGLPVSGTKAELVDRLAEAEADEADAKPAKKATSTKAANGE